MERKRKPPKPSKTRRVKPVEVDAARLQLAITSNIFDPDEAAVFLRFPSREAFERNRRRYGIKGVRFGQEWRYPRETLDAMRLQVFGMKKKKA